MPILANSRKLSDGKPRVSCTPYLYDIADDHIAGHSPFSKIGFSPSFGANVNTDIWSYAGTQAVYLFPTAAMGMEVVSSDNTQDIGTSIKDGNSTGGSTTSLVDALGGFTSATAVAIGDTVILDKSGASPEYGIVTAVSATTLTVAGGFSKGGSGSGRAYNVVDASAYTHAQAVLVKYLTSAYVEKEEIILLNGTGVVASVNLDMFRINGFRVIAAGSSAVPKGNISLRHIDNTPVYSYIPLGFNRARAAIYTVPAGVSLYITDLNVGFGSSGSANKEYGRFTLRANADPDSHFVTGSIFYPYIDIVCQNNEVNTSFAMPIKLNQKTDIKVSAICSATGVGSVDLIGWTE
jgi:hypothetical protein